MLLLRTLPPYTLLTTSSTTSSTALPQYPSLSLADTETATPPIQTHNLVSDSTSTLQTENRGGTFAKASTLARVRTAAAAQAGNATMGADRMADGVNGVGERSTVSMPVDTAAVTVVVTKLDTTMDTTLSTSVDTILATSTDTTLAASTESTTTLLNPTPLSMLTAAMTSSAATTTNDPNSNSNSNTTTSTISDPNTPSNIGDPFTPSQPLWPQWLTAATFTLVFYDMVTLAVFLWLWIFGYLWWLRREGRAGSRGRRGGGARNGGSIEGIEMVAVGRARGGEVVGGGEEALRREMRRMGLI
ncbi:hypothetical protein E8E13_005274 [Curvularia kusanoi]|uniref:Uncharacterized protein n=1 Tax=Curvularia kusanoi TaxID=90978 RepID=A0A9P4WBB1_CURKU|nr:hypothetical protein E8E13_005274 [Curvularia kusanoi]